MSNWNALSHHFDVYRTDPDPGVAANISQIWPALEPILVGLPKNAQILDFGCGTGGLCNQLYSIGFSVSGTDSSAAMIQIARDNSPDAIFYWVSEEDQAWPDTAYSLIASSMVFQFIPDLSLLLRKLRSQLGSNGLLWFSVHNEHYITHTPNSHTRFTNFETRDGMRTATLILSDVPVVTYIRSAQDYERLCLECGFQKQSQWESVPYEDGTPPKYLVQSYRLSDG